MHTGSTGHVRMRIQVLLVKEAVGSDNCANSRGALFVRDRAATVSDLLRGVGPRVEATAAMYGVKRAQTRFSEDAQRGAFRPAPSIRRLRRGSHRRGHTIDLTVANHSLVKVPPLCRGEQTQNQDSLARAKACRCPDVT